MEYLTKLVYNRDKDLVFAYHPAIFRIKEKVYEVHHLEQTIPSPVGAFRDKSTFKKDGILTIHCMNTKDYMKLYNDPKYWNIE